MEHFCQHQCQWTSPLLWAELHPLLCTNTNPHSVKVAVFGLTVAVVQGCPGGLGSACPHEMGFQFIIIIIYNKSRFIFYIYIKTLQIQLLLPLLNDCALTCLSSEASV